MPDVGAPVVTGHDAPRAVMKPSIQRNLVWLTASQIATWSASLIVIVVLPRHLSASDYGSFQFAAAFVGYFTLLAALGTTTYLVKTIARDEEQLGPLLVNALAMKLVLTGFLSIVAIALAYVLGYDGRTMLLIEIACFAMVVNVLNEAVGSALQGVQRMNHFALWRVIGIYAGAVAAIAVLLSNKGVVVYAIVPAVAVLIPLCANTVHIWPELRRSFRIDLNIWAALAKGGLPFLLWSAILVVYGTIDIPLLRAFAGDATVGAYALAYAWVTLPAGFSSIVTTATLPSLSATGVEESSPEFKRLANRSIALVAFVCIPCSIGMILVAPDVFALLHYEAGFDQAIPLLQILALSMPVVGITMVLGAAVIAADRQKVWTLIALGAAVLNPLLNLIAIPLTMHAFDNGAIGAAIITVATEVFMMIGALVIRPNGIMDRPTVSFALRCSAAGLVMIPVVLAAGGAVLPIKVGLGIAAYAFASVGFGTVSFAGLRQSGIGSFAPSQLLNTIGARPE